MLAYIYRAAVYCEDCANDIMLNLNEEHRASDDSERWPQGPYDNGGGEADTPQHCDACHCFLENSLTGDGYEYVAEQIGRHVYHGQGNRDVLREWADFYKNENSSVDNAIQEWQSLKSEEWG